MKILLLNPQVDAEHKLARLLASKGVAVLFAKDPFEAIQMLRLHGSSIDLALVNREDSPTREASTSAGVSPGLEFVEKVKGMPLYADLPMILTTDQWGDAECSKHQNSPLGVNAYLHPPYTPEQVLETIEAVIGRPVAEIPTLAPTGPSPGPTAGTVSGTLSQTRSSAPAAQEAGDQTVLRDTREIFSGTQFTLSRFTFEAPPAEELPPIAPVTKSTPTPPQTPTKVLGTQTTLAPTESVSIHLTGLETQAPPPPSTTSPTEVAELNDPEVTTNMGYLFRKSKNEPPLSSSPFEANAEPLGDAVVPGGAAQSPDLETFKKYLLLREQDVAVLSNQLRIAREQISSFEGQLREEKAKNSEMLHIINEQKQKIEGFDREKMRAQGKFEAEIRELNAQLRAKADKASQFESQIHQSDEEMDHLKDRIRVDIRKIRVREKELENRLELAKRDSEALLGAREVRIIELKRKLDLLEFNMDLLQDRYNREKDKTRALAERLDKAGQIMRVAGGFLDTPQPTKTIETPKTPASESENSEIPPNSALPSRRVS